MPVMSNIFIFSTKYLYEDSYLFYDSNHYEGADEVLLQDDYYCDKKNNIICKAWKLIIEKIGDNNLEIKVKLDSLCDNTVRKDYEQFCDKYASSEDGKKELIESANSLIQENAEINDAGQLYCLAYYYETFGNREQYIRIMQRLHDIRMNGVLSTVDFKQIPEEFQTGLQPFIEGTDYFSSEWRKIAMRKHNIYNNIYAIKCLDYPLKNGRDGKKEDKWINTLVDIAKKIDSKSIVNLILHDKDMQDTRFHKDFVVLEDTEVNELYGSEINSKEQVCLRVSFFMHTYNDIVKFLTSRDQDKDWEGELISILDKNIKQQKSLKKISDIYLQNDADMKTITDALKKEKEDVCWKN